MEDTIARRTVTGALLTDHFCRTIFSLLVSTVLVLDAGNISMISVAA